MSGYKKKKSFEKRKPDYHKAILKAIKSYRNGDIPYKALLKKCRVKGFVFKDFTFCLEEMKRKNEINETKKGFHITSDTKRIKAQIIRLNKTYGFAKNTETDEEYFIPGRNLLGALPGDVVMLRLVKASGANPEAEVEEIVESRFSNFTGVIVLKDGEYKIQSDALTNQSVSFKNPLGIKVRNGDKVMARVTKRGIRHSEHECELVSDFGSALKASACALSIIELNGLTPVFSDEAVAEAKKVSHQSTVKAEISKRLDLRDEIIFTIDGADTKDIDDAISIEKNKNGYRLGVHIADVSHYVKPRSYLDNEAFERGTSVYYANRVIPMLPKELSNGICSLNPNEDRLAFSCIMDIDLNGELLGYEFKKTVIRSRVKGVYSEVNSILDGTADKNVLEKYGEVLDSIPVMKKLADILYKRRKARGAPDIESSESKLVISKEDICTDVLPRSRGISEEIIEDFMLQANMCAAMFGQKNSVPFVYRVHENPPEDKRETLIEGLTGIGIPTALNGEVTARFLSDILKRAKNTPKFRVVNNMVLRSMAKAKYSVEPLGHFGLVLDDYAHFTSPIRRYPDLAVHRIMSDFLECRDRSEICARYGKFAYAAADRSTKTEITAMTVERECEDCYKAEYLSSHIGEVFDAVIVSVMDFGFFAELENTCEGLVRIETLGLGVFDYDGVMALRNNLTGESFCVGDNIRVRVAGADVSSGKVDFELVK